VGKNQSGALRYLNDAGNSESLSTPGYAEQVLVLGTIVKSAHKRFDSLWLIAFGFVTGVKFESHV
jgi:hypothetical protein